MTADDLIAHCKERRAAGQDYVILKVTRKRTKGSIRTREHVRLCGRWLAKIVGEQHDGSLTVDLPIATVLGPANTDGKAAP
jgi:hypothetical protein